MYTIKQTETKKALFGLISREVEKEYNFSNYWDAVKFALHEQIKFIYFSKGSAKTKTNVFKYFYSLESFKYNANKNPLHFCNVSNAERINLKQYYNVLIERNINKLRTY
tara:strand:- start:469 stop:795 length:327 start_codon:yes stop_codon:yes gene_type:complete